MTPTTRKNGNGDVNAFAKWVLGIAAVLAAAGILGTVSVSREVSMNSTNIDRNCERIRDLNGNIRDLKIQMGKRLDRMSETQLEILRAIRK